MGLTYRIPTGVRDVAIHGHPALTTAQGGLVAIDLPLLELWRHANGREFDEVAASFQEHKVDPNALRAALLCLEKAGLLERGQPANDPHECQNVTGRLVSVVIVGFNSKDWLEICLPSLCLQNYSPIEVIVVDNASSDGSSEWLEANYPGIRLVRFESGRSLSFALNEGVTVARGEYFLLLNPDVILEVDAIAQLVASAESGENCAAVAAKLKFLWAPAFLNGLGNFVGPFSWGVDNGLGHLDLAQFDDWREVPSACFAAILIPAGAWKTVGALDERFPLYYEDSEWCYRARLFGYQIRAAPQAIIFHAFSGRVPTGKEAGLAASKLRQVAYGRLRFSVKILGQAYLVRFLTNYFMEDLLHFMIALLRFRVNILKAYLGAWNDFSRELSTMRKERAVIQARRVRTDHEIFQLQKRAPAPLVWNGLPLLTLDIILYQYLPVLVAHPEKNVLELQDHSLSSKGWLANFRRATAIWRAEGFGALLHRFWRHTQWLLRQI